jgi:predicted ATPase
MKITKTTLLSADKCEFGDFNVFIGGNGVGKTTFLLELHAKSAGIARHKYLWIAEPAYESHDIAADMQLLSSSLSRRYEGANLFYFSRAAKDVNGNVDLGNDLRFTDLESKAIDGQQQTDIFNNTKYRRPFIALSSCDARLGLSDSVEITGLDQPPQDSINVLYRNRGILDQIDQTIRERFEFNFVLLDHTKRQLHLGVSKSLPPAFDGAAKNAQDEYEKIERWKVENFTALSESGHGIRSMIRLLTSLLEPVNKIIMIDEPEIHLYPSQKRWLGRQLVSLAKTQGKQVFLVTHDPIILQGILDASTTTNIFRIERDQQGKGLISSCELTQFSDVTATRNQEQYLQGLFYQRCIVVEGASDRSFYQNMIDDYPEVADKDLGFVASGGKASTKHMAVLASKVGLTCSFIYDLDVILFQSSLVRDIYSLLGGKGHPLEQLEELFESDEAIHNSKDDKERNDAIKAVTGYKDKTGVSVDWANKHRALFDAALDALQRVGIFVVPRGTLESWAPDVSPKVRFAELAPDEIRANPDLQQGLDTFLKKVLLHLGIKVS